MYFSIEEFVEKRSIEKKWLNANGYENGDPKTNGEYKTLENLCKFNDLFIDIGANIGEFTEKALQFNPNINVLIFEANPFLISTLSKIQSNANIDIINLALSDKIDEIEFNVNIKDPTTSSMFDRTYMMPSFTENVEKVKVKTDILDSYLDKINISSTKGTYIKIDAEGAELSILQGAQKVFDLKLPLFIQFEYGYAWKESGITLRDAIYKLDSQDFSIFRITPYGLEFVKYYTIDMDDYRYCNYLAVKNVNMDKLFKEKIDIYNKTQMSYLYIFN